MSAGALGRAEVLEELRRLGIEEVTAEYDGMDDEGWINSISFGPGATPADLSGVIEEVLYAVLEEAYAGWENNEGAFGEIRWDVETNTIRVVHNTRIDWLCETETLTV